MAPLAAASGVPAFLSAYRDEQGFFGVAALDEEGAVLFTERLPARGHDTVVSPDGATAVTFARRPGRFAFVTDLQRNRPSFAFEATAGRHFYGHGFFSNDGRLLFATENDYDGERGVVGIYDVAAGYRRAGEFETSGIGPHEALLLRDGRTIVVANGGILTHPDFPRQKLNLPTMAPSLSYIDLETGALVEQVSLPPALRQLSIRHLTETADDAVWLGGQFEGAPTQEVPLVGRHYRGGDIEMVTLPRSSQASLRSYVGSIKASHGSNLVALTSPRGGICLEIDANSLRLHRSTELSDVGGVATLASGFAMTSGSGLFVGHEPVLGELSWDNHLMRIAASLIQD